MVVDDDTDARATIADMLRSDGYEVVAVECPCRAIEVAAETKPDVIVMDQGLPGMSGVSLARELRVQVKPAPEVVLVTGMQTVELGLIYDGAPLPFRRVLVKPVAMPTLLAAVREASSEIDRTTPVSAT